MKKVFLKTFGCQMNARDSELVIGQLLTQGYKLVEDTRSADVILFNTCSVRQHAEDKVWSELGALKKRLSRESRLTSQSRPVVAVIGCMAKNLGGEIFKRMPFVDVVCSPNDLPRLCSLIEKARKQRRRIAEVGSEQRDGSFYKHLYHNDQKHSYVNISEGCSNFCSYCVVPFVRGRHRSRPASEIIEEIKQLIRDGVTSITLLGQNVNDYCSEDRSQKIDGRKIDFVTLIDTISNLSGLKELSFVTSHPKDIDFKLFDLMSEKKNIKKYLHLPVQSGSDRILKLMNRKYDRNRYLEIARQFRKKVPSGYLATDVIVGFPTEKESDFNQTVDLLKKIKFNSAFIFKYSPRPRTSASKMQDDVPLDFKKKRHKVLLDLQRKISKSKAAK